jgi:FkbM family methyltransferase
LRSFKYKTKHFMQKYSQNNEQEIINDYFRTTPPIHKTFLDIGAHDGVTLSNTYALFLSGWVGALVEASPKAFKRLMGNYIKGTPENVDVTKIDIINVALGAIFGVMDFNESGEILGTGDTALVSTFHQSEIDRFKSITQYEKVPVNVVTWEHFLAASKYKKFDFVSIDIEGSEMEILPHMDFTAMETMLVCIEWNGNHVLRGEYEAILSKHGLINLIHTNAENLIYAKQ